MKFKISSFLITILVFIIIAGLVYYFFTRKPEIPVNSYYPQTITFHDENNLSLTHPNFVDYEKIDDIKIFKLGGFTSLQIKSFDNANQLSIDDWIQNKEQCGAASKPKGEKIVINNINVYSIHSSMICPPGGSSLQDTIYLSINNKIIRISRVVSGGESTPAEVQLYKDIVNTIKVD